MKKSKGQITSILLASAMAATLSGCGETGGNTEATTAATESTTEAATEAVSSEDTEAATEATGEATAEASLDFEDGNFAFAKVNTSMGAADKSELEVVDYNGSKALKMINTEGGTMYLGINVSALLGDAVKDLATIQFDIGTEHEDGNFYSTSGTLYTYTGEANDEGKPGQWSVYIDTANPKTATFDVSASGFVAGADNYIIISKDTDNGAAKGLAPANLFIDNFRFLDVDGNVLKADSSAEFGNPSGFSSGVDRSNLFGLVKPVEFSGFQTSAGGWAQAGFEMPQEIIDALVPGSVVEISYSSSTGNMWLVMPDAAKGWTRVGVGDADGSGQGYAYYNSSRNTVQIPYEQLAEVLEGDPSSWGATMQCESDGDWEVYSVKVGQQGPNIALTHAVEFPDFKTSADGWAQAGFDMPQEIIDALVPGSAVEITYKSDTGNMWLVMPGAAKGWTRVGVGDADGSGQGYAIQDGSKAYITYEDLAEVLEGDPSTWGTTMQCESDGKWEVYSVRVGTAESFKATNKKIDIGTDKVSGGGWAQDGYTLTPEAIEALKAGAVINVDYTSESGELWVVMPGAAKGWTRVGVGDFDGSGQGYALYDGSHCQISYEMLEEILGGDPSTWGDTIQFEATTNWEVYGASVGFAE